MDIAEAPPVEKSKYAQDPWEPFTAWDRCDKCGAQAYTLWQNERGHDLKFCGHHTATEEAGLMITGFQLARDERDKLTIARESSATA